MSNLQLQPGDYTTREEIEMYAEREGIELKEAYQRICDAFMAAGADEGEDLEHCHANDILEYFGWLIGEGVYHLASCIPFTRHLTPDQILSASNQEDLQSEKQAEEVALKQIGESSHVTCSPQIIDIRTSSLDQPRDLKEIIHDYIYLLNKTYDEKARELIENQLVDLMDFEYQQLTGEKTNA